MKRTTLACLAACAGLALPLAASSAPVLSLVPSQGTVQPLSNLAINVMISGLQPPGGPNTLLGAFDLTLHYDPAVFAFLPIGSSLGTGLGDPSDPLQTAVGGDNSLPGEFRFFVVSLLEASATACTFCVGPYLQDLQSDSFLLARLLFYAPDPQTTAQSANFLLLRPEVRLSDAAGNPISDFGLSNTTVRIPEPPSAWLVAAALLGVLGLGRRRRAGKALAGPHPAT